MKSFLLIIYFISPLFVSCQLSPDGLIREAEEKLTTNKATISQILTDKKYDVVHPETSFREIIERYCKAETISIATDTIPGRKGSFTQSVFAC